MATNNLGIPVAIVLSGALVAGALYMALRPTSAPVQPTTSEPTKPVVAPTPAPAPTPVDPAAVRASGERDAKQTLEALRPRMVAECWAPAAAKQAEPTSIFLTFNFSFDAGGRCIGVGINEERERNRPDVAQCLRTLGILPTIAAPGAPLVLEIPFTLP